MRYVGIRAVVVGFFALCALMPGVTRAAWNQPVAGSLNVSMSQDGFNPQMADVGGVPYVAWTEMNAGGEEVYVKRFDGGAWTQVGGSLNVVATDGTGLPSIANVGGVPYVVWDESNGTADEIYVKRFDGSA